MYACITNSIIVMISIITPEVDEQFSLSSSASNALLLCCRCFALPTTCVPTI